MVDRTVYGDSVHGVVHGATRGPLRTNRHSARACGEGGRQSRRGARHAQCECRVQGGEQAAAPQATTASSTAPRCGRGARIR